MNTRPGQGRAQLPHGRRWVERRGKPYKIRGIERHGLGAKFPPSFLRSFHAPRASGASRLRHVARQTDSATGSSSFQNTHAAVRPALPGVCRLPAATTNQCA